ncbi:MAG TPA: ATP-binding protein [Candidatus Thiothrix moscowensis]|uniref:response regulator n=1 Tax=unclassified Thiothrix TaxID=2636184 RepID=UPI0025CE6079|nr:MULTISPECIES: response regulator [unclassified Thiothrix]HRJ52659.1 ATP-binding protein [Candidatus Thiothrix moscowensis]HRJ92857.1 ATP-binding protein [Candidatus Thiothrix moscowensis]
MTSTLELVSIQYALALLVGQDLDLRIMLRKFLPPALKLLNCRSGYVWLFGKSPSQTVPAPCYSYPALNVPLADCQPVMAAHLQQLALNGWQAKKPGEIIVTDTMSYHFLPIGASGLLVLLRDPPLPESHLLALGLVLKRLETACLACLQHADLEEARREALQAKEAAEKASKAKSEFLAMISHEIRTPMNGVIGLTDLMLYSEATDTQREYLGMIKSSSRALLDIINEILDFSRIEAGTLALSPAPFHLKNLLQDTFTPLAVRAQEKSLAFHWEIAAGVPNELQGDAGRLRQVMINLVGNAIKFTEHGEVTVNISPQSGAPAGQANLLFAVRDTGIGIPQEKQASIFQPFQQADSSITRRYGGTGLGLTISSQLIAMMGGKLQVDSDLGHGSIFHFSIPFLLAATAKTPVQGKPSQLVQTERPLNILLAEDNAVNRMLAVRLLNKVGHKVTVAENGSEAVDKWQSGTHDIILMDVQMPVMDGLEATTRIRQHEDTRQLSRTPIIALTANAMHGDRVRCQEAGMDGFMSKPFNAQDLLNVLEKICTSPSPPSGHISSWQVGAA